MSEGEASGEGRHGFDFLNDPVLVVTLQGDILETNEISRSLFGSSLANGKLAILLEGEGDGGARYLRLASGSTAPRPGKFLFSTVRGIQAFRTQAARSRQNKKQPQIIVQLLPATSDRFELLDQRVKDLDAKLHDRLLENAALHEALRQNQTLLRELQHRVKNNIQQMMTLIKMTASRQSSPEVAEVVKTAHGRLAAMATAQEAIYQSNEFQTVPAKKFLENIVWAAARVNGVSGAVSLKLDDAPLSSEEAYCLALIANELVTNAAKHGLQNGAGRIVVTFALDNGKSWLDVEDTGTGVPEGVDFRGSGLALVRSLCRQIGGRLEIRNDGSGVKCRVRLRDDRQQKDDT